MDIITGLTQEYQQAEEDLVSIVLHKETYRL